MSIKEIYEYIFYKVYKIMDNEVFYYLADVRAASFLIIFKMFLIASFWIYFALLTKTNSQFSLIIAALIIVYFIYLDMILFFKNDRYKTIVEKFDAWPTKKNFVGTLIVWSFLILIVVNMIFAVRLFDAHQ